MELKVFTIRVVGAKYFLVSKNGEFVSYVAIVALWPFCGLERKTWPVAGQ